MKNYTPYKHGDYVDVTLNTNLYGGPLNCVFRIKSIDEDLNCTPYPVPYYGGIFSVNFINRKITKEEYEKRKLMEVLK